MDIEITKDDFELAVPVARSVKDHVFRSLYVIIHATSDRLQEEILGEAGCEAIKNEKDSLLASLFKQYVCIDAFISEMRGLDVVLTSTGFGVVSTNDTAPASKQRVDAVEGELRVKRLQTKDLLLLELFKVKGWSDSPQRLILVPTLFMFSMLKEMAGIGRPKEEDWSAAQVQLIDADLFLREHVSDDYMDELLQELCSDSLSDANRVLVYKIRRFLGMKIQGNHAAAMAYYRDIINTMERDLEHYQTYAGSSAYELNHLKPYENTAEKSAFHWVG